MLQNCYVASFEAFTDAGIVLDYYKTWNVSGASHKSCLAKMVFLVISLGGVGVQKMLGSVVNVVSMVSWWNFLSW